MKPKQAQAIELLAHGSSITECALKLAVSRRSIHSWLNNQEFKQALEDRKHELIECLNIRMVALNEKALQVLEDCMSSRNESIRLRSASHVSARLAESLELGEIMESIIRINERLDELTRQAGSPARKPHYSVEYADRNY